MTMVYTGFRNCQKLPRVYISRVSPNFSGFLKTVGKSFVTEIFPIEWSTAGNIFNKGLNPW